MADHERAPRSVPAADPTTEPTTAPTGDRPVRDLPSPGFGELLAAGAAADAVSTPPVEPARTHRRPRDTAAGDEGTPARRTAA